MFQEKAFTKILTIGLAFSFVDAINVSVIEFNLGTIELDPASRIRENNSLDSQVSILPTFWLLQ